MAVNAPTRRITCRACCIWPREFFSEAKSRGFELKLLDIGGGFPASLRQYRACVQKLSSSNHHLGNRPALFHGPSKSLPSRDAFWSPSATSIWAIIGKAIRGGKLCYLNDGVYQTFSGGFDHCQYHLKSFRKGPMQICLVLVPPATPWIH